MKHPFENDLFAIMYDTFSKMHPHHPDFYTQWALSDEFADDDNGYCEWRDDGTIVISISMGNTVEEALEVFAHELSHVAVGYDHDHDDDFNSEYENLMDAFTARLAQEFDCDEVEE